jgi:hypothetical protein
VRQGVFFFGSFAQSEDTAQKSPFFCLGPKN